MVPGRFITSTKSCSRHHNRQTELLHHPKDTSSSLVTLTPGNELSFGRFLLNTA